MPLLLIMYILILAGMVIHPDPLVGAMILFGIAMAVMLPILFILHFVSKRQQSQNRLESDLEWRRRYPNIKSFKEFLKEHDIESDE